MANLRVTFFQWFRGLMQHLPYQLKKEMLLQVVKNVLTKPKTRDNILLPSVSS